MPRPGRLDGRTCLIVGGTSGIGLASARRFLEEGARVVVAGPKARASPASRCAPLDELALGSAPIARPVHRLVGRPGEPAASSGCSATRSAVLGGTARHSVARRRDQRSQVRRRTVARVFRRRLGPRHARSTPSGHVPDQSRGRADHAPAAAGCRRPAGHGRERRIGAGSLAVAGPFRHARLRRQQGGRPRSDVGGGRAVCAGADPVQLARSRLDRHADGRPGGERPTDPALPREQTTDRRRPWIGRRRGRGRPLSCASRPRGSSPAPSWSSTAAGAFPRAFPASSTPDLSLSRS